MEALPTSRYPVGILNTIPARSGVAIPLREGQTIKIINTHGTQVVDFFAVRPAVVNGILISTAHLSMCHTRAYNLHLTPVPDDVLLDNQRLPMFAWQQDSTPSGIHDTLIAACDAERYRQLGVPEGTYHENCADNFRDALARDAGIKWHEPPPDPLNLFMNIPVHPKEAQSNAANPDGVVNLTAGASLSFEAPVCRPGDFVEMKARADCVVVMSACPQDILKINNQDPRDAHFVVEAGSTV